MMCAEAEAEGGADGRRGIRDGFLRAESPRGGLSWSGSGSGSGSRSGSGTEGSAGSVCEFPAFEVEVGGGDYRL